MEDASLIAGLLARRGALRRERVEAGAHMAVLANDIEAVEPILYACGYTGSMPDAAPRHARYIIFDRGELRSYVLKTLREADRPMMPREIAVVICHCDGKEAQDQMLLAKVTTRISETLRKLKAAGVVTSEKAPRGNVDLWSMAVKALQGQV